MTCSYSHQANIALHAAPARNDDLLSADVRLVCGGIPHEQVCRAYFLVVVPEPWLTCARRRQTMHVHHQDSRLVECKSAAHRGCIWRSDAVSPHDIHVVLQ